MGFDKATGDHWMITRCDRCGEKLKTYRSKEEIRLEIHTDTNAGVYPVHLCPVCYMKVRV